LRQKRTLSVGYSLYILSRVGSPLALPSAFSSKRNGASGDLPDGHVAQNPVQSSEKNIPLRDLLKSALLNRYPVSQEGRIAIVTDVGYGMRWTRSAGRNHCADERRFADGEVVWSWRPDAGAKFRGLSAK
jgi:hypothetical protein